MLTLRRSVLLGSALALLAAVPAAAGPAEPKVRCSGDAAAVRELALTVDGQPADGLYATPRGPARGLVVFFHGYGHTAESWRDHLARVAGQDGVVAVAMNYRGTRTGDGEVRGWRVAEGAADSIAAARLFLERCRIDGPTIAHGVSMGGNASGLALAAGPLFDWWVDVEGAANVVETYQSARAIAPGNAYAARAKEDIEQAMGGTLEQKPDVYLERTVVARADDIAASGVRGVVVVHGVADGLVPYNQSRELATALRARGVAVHFSTVLTRPNGTAAGTTIDGYVPVPHESPFSGHGTETEETHAVIGLGFTRLRALLAGEELGDDEVVVPVRRDDEVIDDVLRER